MQNWNGFGGLTMIWSCRTKVKQLYLFGIRWTPCCHSCRAAFLLLGLHYTTAKIQTSTLSILNSISSACVMHVYKLYTDWQLSSLTMVKPGWLWLSLAGCNYTHTLASQDQQYLNVKSYHPIGSESILRHTSGRSWGTRDCGTTAGGNWIPAEWRPVQYSAVVNRCVYAYRCKFSTFLNFIHHVSVWKALDKYAQNLSQCTVPIL